jgi:predicted DNA-binding protein (MmcQ/YjbR family)
VSYIARNTALQVDLDSYRSYCLSKKGVEETFPFGKEVLVFKVLGKMFALSGVEDFESVNLKVDPEKGEELRERYPAVRQAYHMNKLHWITVMMDGSIPDKLVKQWIDDSYDLVVAGLPKRTQAKLK